MPSTVQWPRKQGRNRNVPVIKKGGKYTSMRSGIRVHHRYALHNVLYYYKSHRDLDVWPNDKCNVSGPQPLPEISKRI